MRRLIVALMVPLVANWVVAETPQERFRAATAAVRGGDAPGGIRAFRELAAAGVASPSLYWNWAQAAAVRGHAGEAVWALLRCRQLDPGDSSVARELHRVRQLAGLSPSETSPQPLAELARHARRLRAGSLTLVLFGLSVLLHGAARWWLPVARWPVAGAWVALVLALLLAVPAALAPWAARPLATVVRARVPLLDAASPNAGILATLREGEVVPILTRSGPYLRIQDSSGARGWALADEVWPLNEVPPPSALR